MGGRRSENGGGRVSLIYTLGTEDPHGDLGSSEVDSGIILTATIGEDFADCKWPVALKAHGEVTALELRDYIRALMEAVDLGFYMHPGSGAAFYWRWTGSVPPGMEMAAVPDPEDPQTKIEHTRGTGRRTEEGTGQRRGIYLMDRAEHWQRPDFYGRICGSTAISGCVDEDYAASSWPVVVKVHPEVSRFQLYEYLGDFEQCLVEGMFFAVSPALR